jgi:hypothetical protein
MKWYPRKYTDGTLDTLDKVMREGLNEENCSLLLIRNFFRISESYLFAYQQGMNIVEAIDWLGKHKSQRSYSKKIDEKVLRSFGALDVLYNTSSPVIREADTFKITCNNNVFVHVNTNDTEGSENIEEESLEQENLEDDFLINEVEDIFDRVVNNIGFDLNGNFIEDKYDPSGL